MSTAVEEAIKEKVSGAKSVAEEKVSGGPDVKGYRIETDSQSTYFVKVSFGAAAEAAIEAEFQTTTELREVVPDFLAEQVDRGRLSQSLKAYFYRSKYHKLEKFDWTRASQRKLVENLVKIHAKSSDNSKFGYHIQTYIADIPQYIKWHEKWTDFFEQLLQHAQGQYQISRKAPNMGPPENWLDLKDLLDGPVKRVIAKMLKPLDDNKTRPSLVHGDLTLDNIKLNSNGQVNIFAPACLYAPWEYEFGRGAASKKDDGKQIREEYIKQIPNLNIEQFEDRDATLAEKFSDAEHIDSAINTLKPLIEKYGGD